MFSKKNVVVAFAIAQIVCSSFAMEQVSLKDLYKQLLQVQGTYNPVQDNVRIHRGCPIEESFFNPLLTGAKKTGLIKQYQNMLLSRDGSVFANIMAASECLRLIAYMQNQYGQGDPFAYDGKGDKENVVIGEYINPLNKKMTITRYGFFYGVLEQLESSNPIMQGAMVDGIKNTLRKNLLEAIDKAQAVLAEKKSPPAVFSTQLKSIQDFGDALIRANNMTQLENLNKNLENIIKNFQ